MSDVSCPKCGWFHMWPTYHPARTPGWLGRLIGFKPSGEVMSYECGSCGYYMLKEGK